MKDGYKKTDLGWIPEEWDLVKLRDIVDICYGKSQKEVEDENGKYKILGTGGIIGYTNEYLWSEPSVLIGRKGTIDRPQYIEEPFWTVDTLFYTKLRNNNLAKWLFYYLNYIDLKKYNEATGVPSLSVSNLNLISIFRPQLKDQEKIAEILSTVDSQIDVTDKLIEKTKELKKGLMQRLLTKGIGHTEFKKTEVGEIPVKWEVKKLEDVCEFLDGMRKPIKASDRENMKGSIPYYGASGIIDWVNDYIFDDEIILLGEDGENIKSRNVPLAFKVIGKCWVNNHAHVLKAKGSNNSDFITYLLENKNYSSYVIGSAQPKLNQAQCRRLMLQVPSIDEQNKIAEILLAVDYNIKEYENKKIKLEELKKGLMQQLLTGKIRVV
ncbi:restriction endonuclease subunit S [Clostridium paraputrificum]|uniref:restriction endonuclease subunit S n=1 Tax=Clostridium paraputrificum TaxID=29363 RepID=UPI003D336A02